MTTQAKKNLAGTVSPSFTLGGTRGPTILNGSTPPTSGEGQDGDLYVQVGAAVLFMKKGGLWSVVTNTPEFQRETVYRGVQYTLDAGTSMLSVLQSPYTIDTTQFTIDTTELTIDNSIMATTMVFLPASPEGRVIVIKDETSHAGTYSIVVSDATGRNIDGEVYETIADDHGFMELMYSGGQWNVVGR